MFEQIVLLRCFLNEGQIKACFVKKLKLKDGSVPIVHDPDALSEVVSLTLYSIYIYILLSFANHLCSSTEELSCKQICTEMSRCKWSCF